MSGIKMEVRCCCDAHLIGHMIVPDGIRIKRGWSLFVQGPGTPRMELEMAEIGQHTDGDYFWYLALKSKDYPVADLLAVPGFIPLKSNNDRMASLLSGDLPPAYPYPPAPFSAAPRGLQNPLQYKHLRVSEYTQGDVQCHESGLEHEVYDQGILPVSDKDEP